MKKSDSKPKYLKLSSSLNLGWTLAVGMGVFTGLGIYLDQKFNHDYTFLLIGLLLGFAFCSYEVWKVLQKINE